ncbi:hypothetical protein ADL15_46650 [Actinoplanes awajinensis subsp. mycoplanecinus]|uniref:Uncharacterized protein n=1 Tax=Actinoplanes awajinensis subsp. mycoplanecinus TaxID=135947 RepID=A0A101JAD7_9ACTN|nr:hypothetical protein ADL15_46650 [Actinoplanes awajinensis subsp. mycoplanecinus]
MEVNDFYWYSRQITDQLAPRISPNHRSFILEAGGAGAWALAIPELVGALSEEDVVITTAGSPRRRRTRCGSSWSSARSL